MPKRSGMSWRIPGWAAVLVVLLSVLSAPRSATARDYIDADEALALGGLSAGVLLVGLHLQGALSPPTPRWTIWRKSSTKLTSVVTLSSNSLTISVLRRALVGQWICRG